jgi:hypothetical protein
MCLAFFKTWSSQGIRALATVGSGHASTLVEAVSNVKISPQARKGYRTRRKLDVSDGSKPVNALGAGSRQIVRVVLDHMHLAIDRMLYQEQLVKNATVVFIQIDSSTFGHHSMLAALVTLLLVEKIGVDALGHTMWGVSRRAYCLNSFACANKISQDVERKDGRGLYRKEAAYKFAMMLLMSGLPMVLILHQCVVFGMDRGSEGVGAGKGKKWRAKRDAFIGRGSYIEQIFLTFEALAQAINGIAGEYLLALMTFIGVPKEDQIFTARPSPERMDISQPVRRVEMTLVCLEREIDPQDPEKKKKIVKGSKEEKLNSCGRKVSTERHPLAKYPLIKGGSPDAEWCDKHALNTAVIQAIKMLKKHYNDAMKMIRLIRNPYIWKRLLSRARGILQGTKDCRKPDAVDESVIQELGPERMERLKLINPKGLKTPVEACVTRWGLLFGGIAQVILNLLLFSAIMPLAISEGTDDNKLAAMRAVCSVGGFVDEKTLYYKPKVGRVVFNMNEPHFILHLGISRFLNVYCWQPCLAACAHRKDCASARMRGLNSMVRIVQWVLMRGVWACVQIPNAKTKTTWRMKYKLGHRGCPGCTIVQTVVLLLLTARLEDNRAWRDRKMCGDNDESVSPLRHLYGDLYTPGMEKGISDLQELINQVCRMTRVSSDRAEHLELLPPEVRSTFKLSTKYKLKDRGTSFYFRVQLAMWHLRQQATATTNALLDKFALQINDPLGFLVGATDVKKVFMMYKDVLAGHEEQQTGEFYVATPLAVASGNLLLLQCKEILQYNPGTANYVQEPLKSLFSKGVMKELSEFAEGKLMDKLVKDLEGNVRDDCKHIPFLAPINKFEKLAQLAHQAVARPSNNNGIESRWSLLTTCFLGGMRNATARYLSHLIRKGDLKSFKYKEMLKSETFLQFFREARDFNNDKTNQDGCKNLYESEEYETQELLGQKDAKKAKNRYEITNIDSGDKAAGKKKHSKADKGEQMNTNGRGSGRSQPRNASKQLSDSEDEPSSEEDEPVEEADSPASSDSDLPSSDDEDENEDDPRPVYSEQSAMDAGDDESGQPETQLRSIADGDARGEKENSTGDSARSPSVNAESSDAEGRVLAVDGDPRGKNAHSTGDSARSPSVNAKSSDAEGRVLVSPGSKDDNESECTWIYHPILLDNELNNESAKRESKWKLNFTRYLLKEFKWVQTVVEFRPSARRNRKFVMEATLTRLDHLKFTLRANGCAFYVLYTDCGLELIDVIRLENDESNKLLLKVFYFRVLSTDRAALEADGLDIKDSDGRIRMGQTSLSKLLDSQKRAKKKFTTVHKGDIEYKTDAHNIVGVVGWIPESSHDQQGKKTLLENLNAKVCSKTIKEISELDVVVHGSPFSDKLNEDGEEEKDDDDEDEDEDEDEGEDDDDEDDDDKEEV